MPGLTGRMSTVVKAKISKMLDKAEDPAETLEYSYQKQLEQLQNVKKGIADVVTAKKRIQAQESGLQQQVVKLDTQARQALAAGREDLARTALERKNVVQSELQGLDGQVKELEAQQESLTQSEQNLRTKIEQFRTKKEVIKAQYSAAEAQVRISEAATGVGNEMADVGLAMERAMDKTEQMKARASAVQELEAAGTFQDLTALGPREDDIDRQLRELSSTSVVDNELDKLKAELGSGSAATGELGAGSPEEPATAATSAEPEATHEPEGPAESDGPTAPAPAPGTVPRFDEPAGSPETERGA
jgi:phage shock protein A